MNSNTLVLLLAPAIFFSSVLFCADPVKPQLPENYKDTLAEIFASHDFFFMGDAAAEIRLLGTRNNQWKTAFADQDCAEKIIAFTAAHCKWENNPVFVGAALSTPGSLAWCKAKVQGDAEALNTLSFAMHQAIERTAFVAEGIIKLEVLTPHHGTLQAAARLGRLDLIKFLLDRGTPIDALPLVKFEYKQTALYQACFYDHPDIAEFLIMRGANLNTLLGAFQETPLHRAVRNSNWSLMQMLVYAGADVNLQDGDGNTPLGLVEESEDVPKRERDLTIDFLLKHGAKE